MKRADGDPLRGLPIVPRPQPNELFSSWLTRTAQEYYVTPTHLLVHMGIQAKSVVMLDRTVSAQQAIAMVDHMDCSPQDIFSRSRLTLPSDCIPLVRGKNPLCSCRACSERHKREGTASTVLMSWLENWRITCRACGGVLHDAWGDPNAAPDPIFTTHTDEARAGEAMIETYVSGEDSTELSPVTMLRLLLLRRMPRPREHFDNPHRSRWLLHLVIPEFEAATEDHGVNGMVAQRRGLPVKFRAAMLAGLARAMSNPHASIRLLRGSCADYVHFGKILDQDPIRRPSAFSDIMSI